jgi:hypothetical protein
MHGVGVSPDEETVRATTEPVRVDAPADVDPAAPENISEVVVATTPHAGISTAQVASHWIEGEQHAPGWADQAQVGPSFSRINDNQAVLGTAASREMSGEFGHGSASYAMALEPVLRDGAVFGQDYFAADHPGIQPAAGRYMESLQERDVAAANAGRASLAAGNAAVAGYTEWSGAMMSGAWRG